MPSEWFEEGHGIVGGENDKHGVWIPKHCKRGKLFLWTPQLVVADAALEELLKSWHKQNHFVVIPHLFTLRWRCLFNKACDFLTVISPGASFWPIGMFEPLWVGIALPFVHYRPWQLRPAPLLVEMTKICGRCFRKVKLLQGIFCANFCYFQDGWLLCHQAWHEECYTCLRIGIFPMIEIKDKVGNPNARKALK